MEAVDQRLMDTVPQGMPLVLNLADPDHLDSVQAVAESMERAAPNAAELQAADLRIASDAAVPVLVRVALKLALSRRLFREIVQPTHVSVVFAVYKEHRRVLTSQEHPAGEDLVRRKLRQLRWLFAPTPQHSWDLTVVDDGCPEGSGRLVTEAFDDFALPDEEVRVLFLEDAIRGGLPVVRGLSSTSQSQKGGAIRFGLWSAARVERSASMHVALFTDADLSTHLGQVGLLVSPLTDPACLAAIGSRREPASVAVKAGKRNNRGKLFVYLWKRVIPQLTGIIDTQCGFKAFDARHLATWIEGIQDSGFAFDIEFLLRVQLERPGSLRKVAVAWIDSEAESTTTDLEPYLPMLQSIVRLYRTSLPADPQSEAFAQLIEGLDADTFQRLVSNIPQELIGREPIEFEDFAGVSAQALASVVGLEL